MEIKILCQACRSPACIYMQGKNSWYVACECHKTAAHRTREDAILAWNRADAYSIFETIPMELDACQVNPE